MPSRTDSASQAQPPASEPSIASAMARCLGTNRRRQRSKYSRGRPINSASQIRYVQRPNTVCLLEIDVADDVLVGRDDGKPLHSITQSPSSAQEDQNTRIDACVLFFG